MNIHWYIVPVLLGLVSCGGNESDPHPDIIYRLRQESGRISQYITEADTWQVYRQSGDSTIFSGLLSGVFTEACDIIKESQFDDGSFARSPAHKLRGERDFSRDGAIGVLWAADVGCLSDASVNKWVSYINASGGYLAEKRDSKAYATGNFRHLISEVTERPVIGAMPFSSWVPGMQNWFHTDDSEEFLDYASVFLYGDRMSADNRTNPFQLIVEGDIDEASRVLLKYMQAFDGYPCYNGDCNYLRWGTQWGMEGVRPEEFLWIYSLM